MKTLFQTFLFLTALSAGCVTAPLGAVEYTYPVDVGVIDVTQEPWNFDNTGVEDVTAKFQQLVDETIPRKTWLSPEGYWPYIIYFPNGTYRLTDSVVGAILDSGAALGGLVIQGQSRDGVVLKLDDNAAGFENASSPKHLLDYFAGNGTNNAFMNQLENLTIDVGSGNAGAVGVRFHANNTGAVRNVRIVSSDPAGAGFAGLEAVKNTNGPWMIRGLEVAGFDYGLNLGNGENGRHMVSVQDLHLTGQRVAGIRLNSFILAAYKTSSENSVPFVSDITETAMITLIEADLSTPGGGATDAYAIECGSPVFLRDVTTSGYAGVVRSGGEVLLSGMSAGMEWHSHPRNYLWEETPDLSLNLGMEQAPEIEWPDASEWAVVDSLSFEDDDTEAIREAMASGKSMIIFKPKTYWISETIRIPPHVRIIAGQWATLRPDSPLGGTGQPVFELGNSDQEVVFLDNIKGNFNATTNPNPLILNASNTSLVLRDVFWVSGPVYRSEPTRGRVFIENVHSLPGTQNNPLDIPAYEFRGQDVWAYQWNPEMLFPHAVVNGARFVAFGYKTGEMRGPMVDVRNHGYAEIFGGSMNVTHDDLDIDPAETIMLRSNDGNISANFIEMAQLSGGGAGWGRHQFVAMETRNGETRELLNTDPQVVHRTGFGVQIGAVVNLYTGYFDQDNPANASPAASITAVESDESGYAWTLQGFAQDPDSYPAATPKLHWRVVSGPGIARTWEHVGDQVTFEFERAGLYEIEASATDGALEASRVIPLRVVPRKMEERLGRYHVYRYLDNAPQDGEVDLFHPALLQVGDDVSNAHSRLLFSIPISRLGGAMDRIAGASLQLRVDTISGLDNLVVSYAADPGFGIADADDFKVDRIPLGVASLGGKSSGDWVEIDIVPALMDSLEDGSDYVTVWLESDFTNNGTGEFARFSSTTAAEESQRPLFSVVFNPPGLDEASVHIGGLVYFHPVFGHYFDYGSWISHYKLGWLYAGLEGNTTESWFAYSPELGWLYTGEEFYPKVYKYDGEAWFTVE
ncbi:MAG: glycosyl hydrolase family 28-related protein [Oceanipulchritudo sp.]